MESTTDKRLLNEIAKGDEPAFAELFYRYKDKLYSFLLQFADAAAAQDIVQEVFLKVWTSAFGSVRYYSNPK